MTVETCRAKVEGLTLSLPLEGRRLPLLHPRCIPALGILLSVKRRAEAEKGRSGEAWGGEKEGGGYVTRQM